MQPRHRRARHLASLDRNPRATLGRANIRTRWTSSSPARGCERRRASTTRSSTAASTGTAASTAGGRCCASPAVSLISPLAADIGARADDMLVARQGRRRTRLSRTPLRRGLRAPLWLGLAARAPCRGNQATTPRGRPRSNRSPPPSPRASMPFCPSSPIPCASAPISTSPSRCSLARHWAGTCDPALVALIDARARDWFGGDRDCQAWEPGGDEFLSSALTEAHPMAVVLGRRFHRLVRRLPPRAAGAATRDAVHSPPPSPTAATARSRISTA